MNRITAGFWLAALYNTCIILFSKGFGNDLGSVDPLFGPSGCVGILLWGAAYFALARKYDVAPSLAAVFCVEKAFYGVHWLQWMAAHQSELAALQAADPSAAAFFRHSALTWPLAPQCQHSSAVLGLAPCGPPAP
jgi:hypothetical protein